MGEDAGDAEGDVTVGERKFSGANKGPNRETNSSCVMSGKGLWFTTVRVSVSAIGQKV